MQVDSQRTVHSAQIKGSMRRQEALMTLLLDGNGTHYWFKLNDDYFVADSEDRATKVLPRTVKQ